MLKIKKFTKDLNFKPTTSSNILLLNLPFD